MFKSRFILGTAQLNQKYGISNNNNFISEKEFKKIIQYLNLNKQTIIETSNNYNKAEERLSNIPNNFLIYTKISPDKNSSIIDQINLSLQKMNRERIDGFFFHDLNLFLKSDTNRVLDEINYLKKKKIIKTFGFSIYNPTELELIQKYEFDLLQFPLNFADRRFVSNQYLTNLKKLKKKLFIRSVFLQGLLLMDYKNIPKRFDKWNRVFFKWNNFLNKYNLNSLQVCINYVNSFDFIDYKIIGLSSYQELTQIMKYDSKPLYKFKDEDIFSKEIDEINKNLWGL